MAIGVGPAIILDTTPKYEALNIKVNDINLNIAAINNQHPGKATVLFLHGFGGTKEDYVDFLNHPALAENFSFLAYDAPGCGQTEPITTEDESLLLKTLSIPFLVQTALEVLKRLGINKFHLVGHSMGSLTSLLLAHQLQQSTTTTSRNHPQILSFINIKGNLAPEDCFLSRQILTFPSSNPDHFFTIFVQRTLRSKSLGSALYASSLRHKVRAPHGAITSAIFRSMVQLSDEQDLMGWFCGLQDVGVRCMFMHGEENKGLSYLGRLKGERIKLAMVEQSGHFVMYSNPPVMWRFITDFLVEEGR